MDRLHREWKKTRLVVSVLVPSNIFSSLVLVSSSLVLAGFCTLVGAVF